MPSPETLEKTYLIKRQSHDRQDSYEYGIVGKEQQAVAMGMIALAATTDFSAEVADFTSEDMEEEENIVRAEVIKSLSAPDPVLIAKGEPLLSMHGAQDPDALYDRQMKLVDSLVQGRVTAAAVSEEFRNMDTFIDKDLLNVWILDESGYVLTAYEDEARPKLYTHKIHDRKALEILFAGNEEMIAMAEEANVTAGIFQIPLSNSVSNPLPISEDERVVLGHGEDENFTPFFTLLDTELSY